MTTHSEELSLLRNKPASYQASVMPHSWIQAARTKVGELLTKDQKRHRVEVIVGASGIAAAITNSYVTWKIGTSSSWCILSGIGALLCGSIALSAFLHWVDTPNESDRAICKIVLSQEKTQTLIHRLKTATLKSFARVEEPKRNPLFHSDFDEFNFMNSATVKAMGILIYQWQISQLAFDNAACRDLFQNIEGWIEQRWRILQIQSVRKETPDAVVVIDGVV